MQGFADAYVKEAPYETDCFRAGRRYSSGRRGRFHGPRIWTGRWRGRPDLRSHNPPGHRDWRLISVAHEEGNLNDLRAILGNDVAIKAYREGTLPFPDGTIIARLAWDYLPSEENNKVFGRAQSFMAGPPKNGVQFGVSANPLDGCGHILVQNFRRDSVDGRGALVEDAVAVDREASATPAA
jgi:hypothetical protein